MNIAHTRYLAVATLLAATFFIFPIPHTVALRNLFLLMLIGMLVYLRREEGPVAKGSVAPLHNVEIRMLGILTLWMFVQTSLWAVDKAFSFEEFTREWVGTLFVAWLGYATTRRMSTNAPVYVGGLPAWIAIALFAHAGWLLVFQATHWAQTGHYALGSTPYGDYSVLSTSINMAFALLIADLTVRWKSSSKLFPWSIWVTRALFLVTAIAVVAVKARNGVITVAVVLTLLTALLAWREHTRWQSNRGMLVGLVALMLAASIFVINFKTDPRWATFVETIPIALDTQSHKAWLDKQQYPLSTLPSGEQADSSAYDRLAWGKIALEGIASQPQGYGYGLGGFGRYIEERYGVTGFVSSHSGILDFTLANGLLGLLLLLIFCALLFRQGWLAWTAGNPWGLALMLILTNYFVRILLDGHFGSYRLKMVALLLGILYGLAIWPQQTTTTSELPLGHKNTS